MKPAMSARTLVIVEVDGEVGAKRVNAALVAAGMGLCGETTAYGMHAIRTGVEHSYRPDDVCRHCGFPDAHDGYDEHGLCEDCHTAIMGRMAPPDDDPDTCPECGIEHNHQAASEVFGDDQLLEANGFCPRCGWPEFVTGASDEAKP